MNSKKYFTIGPSPIYPTCQSLTNIFYNQGLASESHRSPIFQSIYQELDENLRVLMNIPNSHAILIANSGSEIFERILQNCVESSSFHFVNGSFSSKFYNYAERLKINAFKLKINEGEAFHSLPTIDDSVELIAITHNETSTGIKIQESFIHSIKDKYPTKILTVDTVSSAPFVDLDYSKIDISFFSSQKAFGLPAGLGIWIINKELANQLIEKNNSKGAHNTLADYISNYKSFQTPSTPNVMGMYLMAKIAADMNKIGIDVLKKEMLEKKVFLQKIFSENVWVENENISESSSDTVFNVRLKKDKTETISHLEKNNIICSEGYGSFKNTHIRFSNFPANTWEDMEYLTKVLKLKIC
jgi:phosphoserine aminotransferase